MAEHRIELMKEFVLGPQLFNRYAHFGCEFLEFLIRMGKKLVERGVEQSDRDRISLHLGKDTNKILFLHGEYLRQCLFPVLARVGKNHLPDRPDSVGFKKHMFGPAQPDAFSTEFIGYACILRRIGISSHT